MKIKYNYVVQCFRHYVVWNEKYDKEVLMLDLSIEREKVWIKKFTKKELHIAQKVFNEYELVLYFDEELKKGWCEVVELIKYDEVNDGYGIRSGYRSGYKRMADDLNLREYYGG